VIQVHIQGHADGRPAVDYTVNAEVGVPTITGPVGGAEPVNHVLPAWDLLTGLTATTGLLAALRRRDQHGAGAYLEVALADVALAGVANLGWLSEVAEQCSERPRHGNHVYGSFGVDFATSEGHRVMVVAITVRQWDALRIVTNTEKVFAALEDALDVDLRLETDRYQLRETIAAIMRPRFASRTLAEVREQLDASQVLWSRYRTMGDVVSEHSTQSAPSVLTEVDQPGIGKLLTARSPIRMAAEYGGTMRAPTLGEHTDEVLAEVLGLDAAELGGLHDRGVLA
jgi:2-methylfumaryl-CoA isomerase